MGVLYSPESAFAKEARKWEMDYGPFGAPGRPRDGVPKPFPSMFYKVRRADMGGGVAVVERIVAEDEAQARNLASRGFFSGVAAAAAALEAAEQALAVAAAERNYADRHMSVDAKAEAQAADDATGAHLGSVPETPIRRRPGRPAKIVG